MLDKNNREPLLLAGLVLLLILFAHVGFGKPPEEGADPHRAPQTGRFVDMAKADYLVVKNEQGDSIRVESPEDYEIIDHNGKKTTVQTANGNEFVFIEGETYEAQYGKMRYHVVYNGPNEAENKLNFGLPRYE